MRSSQEEARFIRQGKQEIMIVNAQNYDFTPAVNSLVVIYNYQSCCRRRDRLRYSLVYPR